MKEELKKRASSPIAIVIYILVFVQIVASVYLTANNAAVPDILAAFITVIGKIFALVYFARGFGKDDSKYYRGYFLIGAVTYIIDDFFLIFAESGPVSNAASMIYLLIEMICYGNMLVIGLSKDIGKKWSLALVLINLAIYVAELVYYCATCDLQTMDGLRWVIGYVLWVAGAVVSVLMVVAKYRDKAQRGTK